MSTEDRRAEISNVYFLPANSSTMLYIPSLAKQTLAGSFSKISRLQKISFEELQERGGNVVNQKFQAICSDTSSTRRTYLESLCGIPLILKFEYTNGIQKLVGNKDRPVILNFSVGGNPTIYTLSFARMDSRSALQV